jgi:hypothetical protein
MARGEAGWGSVGPWGFISGIFLVFATSIGQGLPEKCCM